MSNKVSDDFLISGIIKVCNDAGEPIWFDRLERLLEGRISGTDISRNVTKLSDYGIIDGTWEKGPDGSWIRAFAVTDEASLLVDRICREKVIGDETFDRLREQIQSKTQSATRPTSVQTGSHDHTAETDVRQFALGTMLLDFSVTNHGPFRDTATIDMNTSDTVIRNMNTVILYGPNSSGKSSLLCSFRSFASLVSDVRESGFRYPWYDPFADNDKPTAYRLRCIVDGVLYDYSVSHDRDSITSESLHRYTNGRRSRVFDRASGKDMNTRISPLVSSSSAYLAVAARFNDGICGGLIREIRSVDLLLPSDPDVSAVILSEHPEYGERLVPFMRMADPCIVGILSVKSLLGPMVRLRYSHRNGTAPLSSASDGTVRMFRLLTHILRAMDLGRTVMIDDLDLGLHPSAVRSVLSMLHSEPCNEGMQLMFSARDPSLLDGPPIYGQVLICQRDASDGSSSVHEMSEHGDVRE